MVNLGYVQSSPRLAEDGSVTIVYHNGDPCGERGRYSTRLIFQCDDNPVSPRPPPLCPRRYYGLWGFILHHMFREGNGPVEKKG